VSVWRKVGQFAYDHAPDFLRDQAITLYSRRRGKLKFGPRFHEYLTDLDRTQRYSAEELRLLQDEKVRRLVHYAAVHVPYYTDLLRRLGIAPRDIRGASDLSRLPVLTKQDVQEHGRDLRSTLYRDQRLVEVFHTSGTTGKPLDVAVSLDYLQMEKAFTWLHRSWGGIAVGDRTAAFVGFPVVPFHKRRPPFWAHDRSENRTLFSLHHMMPGNMPAYAEALVRLSPRLIYGYPTAIYLMALHLVNSDNQTVRPQAVFTASESLLPHHRAVIEQAFACRVFDWYGATEMTANIVQCEHGTYHVKSEYGVVEFLRPDGSTAGPGEQGIIVATGLNNMAMPLIRYRLGDTAVPRGGTCACGRAGILVERIVGRLEDVVVTPDGRWISRLDFVFKSLPGVAEAQIVQEEIGSLRVRIVRREGYGEIEESRVLRNLRVRLGDDIKIRFEYPDRIPRTRGGKFRYVVSKVPLGIADARQSGELLGVAPDEDATL